MMLPKTISVLFGAFLLLIPVSLSAQKQNIEPTPGDSFADGVKFDEPEGYVDIEFKELAKEYIQPKVPGNMDDVLDLDGKLTPVAVQRLIDLVSQRVYEQMQEKDSNLLKNKTLKIPNNTANQKFELQKPLLKKIETLPSPNKEKPKQERKRIIVPLSATKKEAPPFAVVAKTPLTPLKKKSATKDNSTIRSITLDGVKNNRINTNNASYGRQIKLELGLTKNIQKVDLNVLAKNVQTNKLSLLAHQTLSTINKESLPISLFWNPKDQARGSYKLFVEARFYGSKGSLIKIERKIWGDTDSPTKFVVVHN